MMDKLNLPNRKVRGEVKGFEDLFCHLRFVVAHEGRHPGVEHQLQALSVVENETQPEMVLVNISTTIRDHGTLPRCGITLYRGWLKCQIR
jgi:alanine racemase